MVASLERSPPCGARRAGSTAVAWAITARIVGEHAPAHPPFHPGRSRGRPRSSCGGVAGRGCARRSLPPIAPSSDPAWRFVSAPLARCGAPGVGTPRLTPRRGLRALAARPPRLRRRAPREDAPLLRKGRRGRARRLRPCASRRRRVPKSRAHVAGPVCLGGDRRSAPPPLFSALATAAGRPGRLVGAMPWPTSGPVGHGGGPAAGRRGGLRALGPTTRCCRARSLA